MYIEDIADTLLEQLEVDEYTTMTMTITMAVYVSILFFILPTGLVSLESSS